MCQLMSLWVASSVPTCLAFLVLVERGLSSGVERLLDDACACLEGRSASTAVLHVSIVETRSRRRWVV